MLHNVRREVVQQTASTRIVAISFLQAEQGEGAHTLATGVDWKMSESITKKKVPTKSFHILVSNLGKNALMK